MIGGSAGALQPLTQLVRALPFDLDAAVLITLHHPPNMATFLPNILARETLLRVQLATDGELLRAHIYVTPPGHHHALVCDERVWLKRDPRLWRRDRSTDALFESAAFDYGPRCTGVVLSGANRDGAAGVGVMRAAGGHALAQEPAEACFPSMPRAALSAGADFRGGIDAIARRLAETFRPKRFPGTA